MTVDITRTPCSDGMSDRRYPDTVRVTTRRGTARGCGGLSNDRPGPGASLAGTSWTIAAIDGRPVRLDRPANVEFTRHPIHGMAGCPRLHVDFSARPAPQIGRPLRVGSLLQSLLCSV